ncbi:uncharacterized protein Z518_04126 [Rhinocladiella mackenziei CBS 650.93]|uniref:Family A G protein-coupled receptor-like protein n=1 Tax=Rhinocladiella mackenziei CBS 650.93 TaxID=1442369 RepID=A0A0D2FVG8_9EURO|nr:uncharacterized protein Z518_04126 [Rhinocladiella mackenziei CBS 650.93]KIX06152.1 hypothetical protein Z518_04126 [Rhinocladiella mackenziei CBS 650.93]
MGNEALRINGFTNTVTTNNHITTRGSDWYFTVCAVMTVSALVFMILAFYKTRSQRLFYYITASMTMVAAISYFCMGSNLGWTAIEVEWRRSDPEVRGNMRQIFYVRYIDFFITTPLLLADLLLVCALPTATTLYVLLMSEVMVIMGLVGALVHSSYKWGFFTFGVAAYFFVAYTIIFDGRAYARTLGADILQTYTILGVWTATLFIVYPVAWGVSEGGNVIPPDSEAIMYGILDILTKPVFGGYLIWALRNVDIERLGIHIRDINMAPAAAPASEKAVEANPSGAGETPMVAPPAENTTSTAV